MDNRKVIIYTLSNPETNEVFYVGRTILTLAKRLTAHHVKAQGSAEYVIYLHELNKKGLRPVIEYVDECNWDCRKSLEEFWIQTFSMWGFQLTNNRHLKNKSVYTYKEKQRKRERSFILKTVDADLLKLIYFLYAPADTNEIGERLGCTAERVRSMMDRYRRTESKKFMEWVKPIIEEFYLEKGKYISELYLKTQKYGREDVNTGTVCQN